MEIKPIKTEADYEATLDEIQRLLEARLTMAKLYPEIAVI